MGWSINNHGSLVAVRGAGAAAVDERVFGTGVTVHALLEVHSSDLNEDRLAVGQVAAGCRCYQDR